MHVAVEALALGLEALEHPLRHLDRLVGLRLGEIDPGAEEVGRARLDVLHHELELLQPPVVALRLLVGLAARGTPSLGFTLIRLSEPIDLLAEQPNVATQRVDDFVELRVEIVALTGDTSRLFRARSIAQGARCKTNSGVCASTFQPDSIPRTARSSPGRTITAGAAPARTSDRPGQVTVRNRRAASVARPRHGRASST